MTVLKSRIAKRLIHRSMTVRRANGTPGHLRCENTPGYVRQESFLSWVDRCPTGTRDETVPGTDLDKKLKWLR